MPDARRPRSRAIPADAAATTRPDPGHPLGSLDLRRFFAQTWQRQPLLIRAALPPDAAASLFDRAEVLALARHDDVESRVVRAPSADGRRGWRLRHGPFDRLPPRREPGWTLLVQGVDLHLAAARALMDRFRFVPDARLDDLMISVATDGGGVGPHVDSYDVFLLQAQGRRRWRLGPPATVARPHRLLPDVPLKILDDFEPTAQWELGPGDILYVPPGWAHDGVAIGDCMTCSIGFRAPSPAELRRAFLADMADADDHRLADGRSGQRRYRDRQRSASATPARIPDHMLDTLVDWVERFRPDRATIADFVGRYLTEPKPAVWFDAAGLQADDGPGPRHGDPAAAAALQLDRRTRMMYAGATVFINGEALNPSPAALRWLQRLADRRRLDADEAARAGRLPALAALLHDWQASGWIHAEGASDASD